MEALSALEQPEILNVLKEYRIESILIERLSERGRSAVYDYRARSITINSARKLGVHYGEEFRPGVTGNMSAAPGTE
jgi:hypothetical protein